jgi:ribosome-binding factor A
MKSQSQRQLRAGELVRRALSEIFAEGDLHDPALVGRHVTVTEVRMSPDLRHAQVLVDDLLGGDRNGLAQALDHAHGFLQKELGRRIDLKFTPKLRFTGDDRGEEAMRLQSLLDKPGVKRDLD